MSELMPFRPHNQASRIRRNIRGRAIVRKTKRRVFGVLGRYGIDTPARLFLTIFAGLFFLTSFMLAIFSIGLPNPARMVIYAATQSTKVYDRNGVVLSDIYNEKKRTTIASSDMPKYLKEATIAIEDKDFYHHNGFDLRGFVRGAIVRPLTGHRAQGGSTITQQFVKNAILGDSRTVARKAKELILSFEIEQIYSKDKILELYLNEIPYGTSAYGVEAASMTYFGKHAKDITLPEAATLAALPQAPSRYSPYGANTDLLMARKDTVLGAMREQGYISQEEYNTAKSTEIKFQPRKDSIRAPHFVQYIKEILADKYGEKALEDGGLKITTTLDWDKQKAAEDAITARADSNVKNYNANNAAMVSIDPNTGEILAMVGSKDYLNSDIDGQLNVALRPRQPGSSIKPIVYATAFKKGYGPATMLMDVQTNFGDYTPRNYDGKFRGPVPLRQALDNSLNIPAVKTLAYAGVQEATQTATDMGITTLTDPERYGLSLTLGGGEVTLLELTRAYGVFAAGGMLSPTLAILKVEDQRGHVLEENEPEKPKRVLDAQVAYLINNILSDDPSRAMIFGTGGPLTLPGRTVAAKTGTTNDYKDGWTLGYTPDLVAGFWAGNNDNESMTAASGLVAAPMWHTYMQTALAGVPNKSFDRPEGIRDVVVDSLTGKLPGDGTQSTKTEIFTSWGVPTEKDTSHKVVKVVKAAPDKLAPANFPANLTMDKVFTELHSERPDNAAWEAPVIAWATANGYNNIPTETYGGPAVDPDITIVAPSADAKISGVFTVSAQIKAGVTAKKVEVFYDGVSKGIKTSGPFDFQVDSGPKQDGTKHVVSVRMTRSDDTLSEDSMQVTLTVG